MDEDVKYFIDTVSARVKAIESTINTLNDIDANNKKNNAITLENMDKGTADFGDLECTLEGQYLYTHTLAVHYFSVGQLNMFIQVEVARIDFDENGETSSPFAIIIDTPIDVFSDDYMLMSYDVKTVQKWLVLIKEMIAQLQAMQEI